MLRNLLRFLSPAPQPPEPIDPSEPPGRGNVVLYAHLAPRSATVRPEVAAANGQPNQSNHRQRLMSMQFEHTRLCSKKRCDRLRDLGISTVGDLATADPKRVASGFGAPRKAIGVLKQYRRAVRLAASVPGMMPRDAHLLISIHRRSIRGLADESPAALHRDLQRFAESTPGRQQLRGRRIPSTKRIKRWIAACETHARRMPSHVTAV